MQIVIDIPEKLIELAQRELVMGGDMPTIANAISNGIVLPKGHGDLIDRDELIKNGIATKDYLNTFIDTIIEADKGE